MCFAVYMKRWGATVRTFYYTNEIKAHREARDLVRHGVYQAYEVKTLDTGIVGLDDDGA